MGSNDYLYFYGPSGKLLSIRSVSGAGLTSMVADRVYFGGMLLGSAGPTGAQDVSTLTDRLGTAATGYPYGTDKGGSVENDQPDFATYTKDGTTGFEYAMNRYYSAGMGRFLTVDPYGGSARPLSPSSWNKYAYVESDPIERTDSMGLIHDFVDNGDGTVTCNTGESVSADGGSPDEVLVDPSSLQLTYNPDGYGALVAVRMKVQKQAQLAAKNSLAQTRDQISCQKDVRSAMLTAWAQSGNGTSGAEAGFRLDGNLDKYTLVPNPYTNQPGKQTITVTPGQTFAVFHVPPNNSGPQPSDPSNSSNGARDTTVANKYNFDIFVESQQGLYVYNPGTNSTFKLQSGLDWTKPCP